MAKDKIEKFLDQKILDERLEDIIGDRFGRYSKYIIQERAIPDVRDGLKPVQRRILYGMADLKLFSSSNYKKSARIAGEVMGKYHPHGDSSIYEAMVRMSQDWKMGVPLIEMHGNNGSIDGDSAAAMRYTEVRLSGNSDYLIKDLHERIVSYAPNFDDSEVEPTVLPAKFPNILVNGSTGISAGYATNIPPHNISEVINATIALIDKPSLSLDGLLDIMQGPDFPTGGIVQGIDGIRQAFATGRGKVIVRSKVDVEPMGKEQVKFVITEIPYEVNKANLVKKMEQYRIDGTLPDVQEVRDESNIDGLRVVVELKKGANQDTILTYLFKNTELQVSYNYNMVVISDHRPMTMGVIDILKSYINHQKEVITNRSNFQLEKALARMHILEGLMKLVDVLDDVIAIIRASKGKADSKANIIAKYGFTELQAEAIVTLQLYRLSSTDIFALIQENDELIARVAELRNILANEKELLKVIKSELREVNKAIGRERRSVIEHEVAKLEINETHLISKEEVMVNVTKDGYIKRANLRSFSSTVEVGLKDGDASIYQEQASTLDTLLCFTNLGNYVFVPVHKIVESKWKDIGNHLNTIALLGGNEFVINVIKVSSFDENKTLLLCSKNGLIKQTTLKEFEVQRYSKVVRGMKLSAEDSLISVDIIDEPLEVIVATEKCEVLRFRASEIAMYGTGASGIKSISLKGGDKVVGAFYTNNLNDVLLLTKRGYIKRMKVDEFPLSKRSRAGSTAIKMIKANPHLLVSAKNFTPNQYKENVMITVLHKKSFDLVPSKEIKYNVSDAGKQVVTKNLNDIVDMYIAKPSNVDEKANGDYLIEVLPEQQELFPTKVVKEKPKATKKPASTSDLLANLNSILDIENLGSNTRQPIVSNTVKKEGKPDFKMVTLFGEEED